MLKLIFNKAFVLALIILLFALAAIGNVDVQGYRSKATDYIATNL